MFKKQKILLAAGCSYTDPNFLSRDETIPNHQKGGWKMWPELVAEELNLKCVNYGRSGRCNDYILQEILTGLSKYRDQVDTVAVLLTGAERYSFFGWPLNPPIELFLYLDDKDENKMMDFEWMDNIGGKININYWQSDGFTERSYKSIVDRYYNNILTLIKVCEAYKVNLVIMQGIVPIHATIYDQLYDSGKLKHPGPNRKLLAKWAMVLPAFQEIEEKYSDKIIGWPILSNIGGFWYDLVRDISDTKLSEIDFHPNAKGQADIASYYIKKLKG